MGLMDYYKDNVTFLNIYDVRISQKTLLCAYTACYRDRLNQLYVISVYRTNDLTTRFLLTWLIASYCDCLER
jgi:hypothetical protein